VTLAGGVRLIAIPALAVGAVVGGCASRLPPARASAPVDADAHGAFVLAQAAPVPAPEPPVGLPRVKD
jgi:hypothetical protein